MNGALCVLAYVVALVWLAPAALRRITHRGLNPRLAVTLWLTAIAVAVGGWLVGSAGTLWELLTPHAVAPVMGYCTDMILLVHHLGWGGDVALSAAVIGALTVSGVAVRRIVQALYRFRCRSREHADAAHILGSPTRRRGVVIMHTDRAAAYCVAGRPDAIVVTSAAVATLTGAELAAVVAHERAHLFGRHPQLMMVLRALAASMPALPLFSAAECAVGRLVEMSADDSAVRHHGRDVLLHGLVALAGQARAGGTALAAADTAVVARAERLAAPSRRRAVLREQLVLTATMAALVFTPVALMLGCHP